MILVFVLRKSSKNVGITTYKNVSKICENVTEMPLEGLKR